jgi:hypothetical protein
MQEETMKIQIKLLQTVWLKNLNAMSELGQTQQENVLKLEFPLIPTSPSFEDVSPLIITTK